MINGTRCRCRFCERRKTLRQHPDHYVRPPLCGCSRERKQRSVARAAHRPMPRTWRVDKYRNTGREQRSVGTCRPDYSGCDGYSHPHARGRGWCMFNENRPTGPREHWS